MSSNLLVAPYVWFICPTTKKCLVCQVIIKETLPPSFSIHCNSEFGGCGKFHENNEVKVVAIGRYLAVVKESEHSSEERMADFEAFLQKYKYMFLPEEPKDLSKEDVQNVKNRI